MTKEIIYKDSAKDFTIGTAIDMYELGVATAVNDNKDITIIFEKENEMKKIKEISKSQLGG